MIETYLVHPGHTYPIVARATSPDEPGRDDGGWAAASYAFWQAGYGEQWQEDAWSPHRALTYSVLWGCVSYISQTIASLGWHQYERQPRGRKDVVLEDPISWLVGMQANPETNAFDWRQTALKDALLWGNSYSEIERTGSGRPWNLWRLDPGRVSLERDDRGSLYYRVRGVEGGKETILDPANVFHLKGLGPDGLTGYSVVEMARKSIELGLQEERFGVNFFRRGPMPGGVLEIPGAVKKQEREEMRTSFEKTYGGSERAGRVVVLSGGAKFTAMTMPNDDAQWIEGRTFQADEICRWFRVPPHKVGLLARSTFCVPGDAAIFTEAGPRPACEVVAGDRVWSRAGQEWVLSRVKAAASTGTAEVLEIRAGIRTLRCTANHRVPVRRETLVPCAKGPAVVIDGRKYRRTWEVVWIEAGEIRPGDQLLAANGFGATGVRSCPTREECSVEFMEALGMIIGDGYFGGSRGYKTTFGLSHGEGEDYLPHYITAIEAEFQAGDGPYAMRNGGRKVLKARARDKNTTAFYSSPGYAELEALGIVGTAKTKRIPSWVFGLADDLKIAFLRGYLDADGTINKAGNIRYVSVNRQLLDEVRHLAASAGIRVGNLFSAEIESDFGSGKKYRHTLWAFVCTKDAGERIGSHSTFCRDRTTAKIARRRKRVCKVYPCEARHRGDEPGILFAKVLSIRSLGEMAVYDLSVEGTENFVCDLVEVHNSNIEQQSIEAVQDCLLPWCARLEAEANTKLYGRNTMGRRFTRLNLDTLLRGDSITQTETVVKKVASAILTPNEAREYLDLNPIEGADDLVIQGAMVPLDTVLSDEDAGGVGPGGSELLEVPDVAQEYDWDCGAAATAAVAEWLEDPLPTYADYIRELGTTPADGTDVTAILSFFTRRGHDVEAVAELDIDTLADLVTSGRPVICPVQDYGTPAEERTGRSGHYVVVVGVALGYVFLRDPSFAQMVQSTGDQSSNHRVVSTEDFLVDWHDMDADGTPYDQFGIAIGEKMQEAEEVEPEPAQVPAKPAAPGKPEQNGQMPEPLAATFRSLLAGVYDRLLRVEADKARRSQNNGLLGRHLNVFYPLHQNEVKSRLIPVLSALLIILGKDTRTLDSLSTLLAQDHCKRSITDLGKGFPDNWPGERASCQAVEHLDLVVRTCEEKSHANSK